MKHTLYVDAHCHLAEFGLEDILGFVKTTYVVAVSEDLDSSTKTLGLAENLRRVVPCVGIHPWEAHRATERDVREIERLVASRDLRCLGEAGLDRRFVPKTWHKQLCVFRSLLRIARDYDLVVNLHAAGAWREVCEEVIRKDIRCAIFHWYTGPLDTLEQIFEVGYYITINPSIRIQGRQRRIVEVADLGRIMTESDGPYNYRGLYLNPRMLPELVGILSELKGVASTYVKAKIWENFKAVFADELHP